MRGLVVGLGSIGRRHARNWAALGLGQLAICRQHNAPQPEPLGVDAPEYHDLQEALDAERPDVVLVTNPTSLHVETACAAIRAGAHVFVEKPLGSSLAGVHELLELAAQRQKLVMVAYNLRFHPGLARLKTLVERNAVGKIVSARAEMGEYLADWHPWEDYRGSYSGRSDLGGGAVLTLSHELDALCWLLGPPRRLTAITAHTSSLETDTEDVAEIILELQTGGVASAHMDYVRRTPRRIIELVGEEGVLRWNYHVNVVEHYAPTTRRWRLEEGDPAYERNQMYVDELRHLAACLRREVDRPLIDGPQGAAILALSLAALRSSAEGRTIDLGGEDVPTKAWLSSLGK